MPIVAKRMPFMGHIGELRKRVTVVAITLVTLMIGLYFFAQQIYDILVAPIKPIIGDTASYTFDVLEGMTNRFRLSMWAAIVVASPIIIYQALAFFLPALKAKERRWFVWTFAAAVFLFLSGVAFCYFIILGPSAQWLVDQNGEMFSLLLRAQSLMTFVMYFLMGFGIAFLVPIVVFYLVFFGVVPYEKLASNWRIVWVVIVIVAAMITPTGRP